MEFFDLKVLKIGIWYSTKNTVTPIKIQNNKNKQKDYFVIENKSRHNIITITNNRRKFHKKKFSMTLHNNIYHLQLV